MFVRAWLVVVVDVVVVECDNCSERGHYNDCSSSVVCISRVLYYIGTYILFYMYAKCTAPSSPPPVSTLPSNPVSI